MAEYIEREAAIAALPVAWDSAVDALRYAPAADVAPVVRCKDCKWFADNNDGEWFGCWLFNAIRVVSEDAPTPDDFCSCGEKMDGGAGNAAD